MTRQLATHRVVVEDDGKQHYHHTSTFEQAFQGFLLLQKHGRDGIVFWIEYRTPDGWKGADEPPPDHAELGAAVPNRDRRHGDELGRLREAELQERILIREQGRSLRAAEAKIEGLREGIRRTLELHAESAIRLTLKELLDGAMSDC
jgi:hypothetical protein